MGAGGAITVGENGLGPLGSIRGAFSVGSTGAPGAGAAGGVAVVVAVVVVVGVVSSGASLSLAHDAVSRSMAVTAAPLAIAVIRRPL
ncbi:hypothetical protein [Mycobacterium sp. IDR2000157661]|uniref:hypothetical protein n=1 Tax=Mycobacterium sp. IDR2000157661 TaxID=2867005 RepID=UPI00351D56BF